MKRIAKLFIGLACVSLGLTACKEDYFDPEAYQAIVKDAFPVSNISPDQDWAIFGTATATVRVNGDYGEQYRVAVYQENPLFTSPVTQLGMTEIVSGEMAKLSFSYLLASPIVYFTVYDKYNRRVVQAEQASTTGTMEVNFFGESSASARRAPFFSTRATVQTIVSTNTYTLNGSEVSDPEGYFTHDTSDGAKFSFNNKFKDASYDGITFTKGLKMEGSTKVMFTTSNKANITIVQSDWESNDVVHGTPKTIKFDGTEQDVATAATGTGCRIYTLTNVSAGSHTITRGSGESGLFYVKVVEYTETEQSTINTDYTKTANDYLNPTVSGMTTQNITVSGMQAYDAFTDDLIDSNGNILLNGGESESTTTYVSKDYFYIVEEGFNPSNGEEISVYGDDGVFVGTLIFYGSGSPAVADTDEGGPYTARINRKIVGFTPALNGQLNMQIKGVWGPSFWVTDNGNKYSYYDGSPSNGDPYIDSAEAGHTYLIWYDGTDIGFYGLKLHYEGTVTTGGTPLPGDGHHFRVASGTTITKTFNLNGTYGVINDMVVYVEGTVHLNGNTLNGPTIVVADGGKLVIDGSTTMSNAGRIVVLSGGTVENNSTNTNPVTLNVANGSPVYNAGNININGELNINGCDFYNCGSVNVTTLRNTSNGKLTNFGSITAVNNTDAADAYNCEFINGCYLHYTSHAGIGKLTMLPNSRLDVDGVCEFAQSWTEGFDASTPYNVLTYSPANPNILMDKSIVNVGTAYVTNTVFQGPSGSGEYAIVKMGKVAVGNGTDLMQRQNCYFDWNITELYRKDSDRKAGTKYQDIPESEKANNPWGYLVDYYKVHLTKFVSEESAPAQIHVDASDCTGSGYNGTPTEEQSMPQTTTFTYRYCFEDNFPQPGDYDFNDCVMTVTPKVTDNVVELTVSLEAVGASKLLAGALRVKGVTESDISSATVAIKTGHDLDKDLTSNILTYIGNYQNSNGNTITAIRKLGENDDMTILTSDGKTSQAQNDLVIRLFNDAHWTMAGDGKSAQERLIRHFYNTMTAAISPTYSYLDPTPARSVTYTITFPNTDDGKAAAAKFGVTSNLDPFIVERHNSIFWEVHTYPFKWDQVLSAYENDTKLNSYRYADGHSGVESAIANYPWAICVPGSFQYPLEYNSICGTRTVTGNTMGTTSETYQYFSSWAENKNSHQDWYNYPTSGMVWTGQ